MASHSKKFHNILLIVVFNPTQTYSNFSIHQTTAKSLHALTHMCACEYSIIMLTCRGDTSFSLISVSVTLNGAGTGSAEQ